MTGWDVEALIGRDLELDALTAMIDAIGQGGAAIAVIGDAGIGKSSLLRAVAGYGRRAGLRVLRAEGVESEAQLPFGPLHQLLRPVLDAADRLPGPQRQALAAALGAGDASLPEPFLIALATLNLLADAASDGPLLLVVDDVQWLDPPSREVLTFVARRLASDPVILVGTVRRGHEVAFTTAGLPPLDLRGLDGDSARAVLAAHGQDLGYGARERILAEASGNPLALVELPLAIRAAAGGAVDLAPHALPLTARLERAFAARLADLPADSRDAMLVAAVDYSDDTAEILAGASALSGRPADVETLEPPMAAGLITFDGLHVRFGHPLVRSGVLNAETITRRQAAHAALARVLDSEPYRQTWHRAHSVTGPDDAIADALEALHAESLRRGSATEAIWALERSAQLTTDSARRGRRLLLAAGHAFALGRADLVDQLLGKAARTRLSRLDQARMEWLREIFNDGVPGDAGRVLDLCAIAVESIEAGDRDLALNLLLAAALRCWWADTGPAARARVAEVTHLLPDAADDPRYAAALGVAEPVLQAREVIGILDVVVLESVSDPAALWLLGMAAHAVGDPVHATDFLGRAESRLRQQGRLALLSQVLTMQTLDNFDLGDFDRAAAAIDEGRRLALETGQPIWDTGSLSLQAVISGLHGADDALELAARVEHDAGGRRLTDLLACVQLARGLALLNEGQHAAAYTELRRMFDPADPAFHLTERFHAVTYLAEAAAQAGLALDVRPVITALEAEALVTPSPTLHLQLRYARAVLADEDDAEGLYLAALRADLVRWPWLRARTELAYGKWLRRQRRAAQSRQPLRSALTTFEIIGAASWAEQARAELRAAGERTAEGAAPAAASSLSAQELQIARLAAQGLSNREIGERLYLSPRTVGSHLYRIFPKLDITSRGQLADRIDLGAMSATPPVG